MWAKFLPLCCIIGFAASLARGRGSLSGMSQIRSTHAVVERQQIEQSVYAYFHPSFQLFYGIFKQRRVVVINFNRLSVN